MEEKVALVVGWTVEVSAAVARALGARREVKAAAEALAVDSVIRSDSASSEAALAEATKVVATFRGKDIGIALLGRRTAVESR